MAKVFLDSGDSFTISNNGATVFGASGTGTETVTLATGVTGAIFDQAVEKVTLAGNASDYTYKSEGADLVIYSGATMVARTTLQSDTDGTLVQFASSGVVSALLGTTGVVTLGGATVSSDTAGPVTPVTYITGAGPTTYTLTSDKDTVIEGTDVAFTVTRTGDLTAAATLTYNTTGDTNGGTVSAAVPGTDTTPVSGNVTFAAGSDTATFTVSASADSATEGLEGLKVSLFNGTTVVGTKTVLVNDDPNVQQGQTFTLTTGTDNFTGADGNDTFTGTYDGAATSTFNVSDVLAGGKGTDVLNITATDDAVATLPGALVSGIETVNIRNVDGDATAQILTVNASNFVGATTFNADRSTDSVTFSNLGKGAAFGVIGNGTVVGGAVVAGYATTTDAVTLNIADGTKMTVGVTITTGTATSATINSTGAANTIGTVDLATASLTSVTINAATNLKGDLLSQATDQVGTDGAVTISGAATTVELTAALDDTIKTINASGLTAGGVKATLGTGTQDYKGGAGVDTITLNTGVKTATFGAGNDVVTTTNGAGLAATAAGAISGGDDTDTLIVKNANDVDTATERAVFTSFETLNNATSASIAADGFTGVNNLITSIAGGGFTGMTAAQAAAVKVTVDLAATATTYALTTATGGADVLGLNIASSTAATELDATALTVTGFETVNLAIGSGVKTLYNAAGTTQLTAGTDYTDIGFTAAADLKTVNISGDYAAQVDVTTLAKVTAVNASANTAGADIVVGGQTGSLVVTGSESRDVINLGVAGVGGLQTVNAGGGNDSIVAAQAEVAVASINGDAGTDTLTVNDAGAVVVNDNNFAGVSSIEKLNFSAATGLTFSVGGYANGLATANAGVLDITAGALTGATTIDGTGLSATNALKLTLTNVDTAANATATNITLSQGADNIKIVQSDAGDATTDTITISGGVAALASTAAKTIDLSGVVDGGAISVTTGAGADVVKAAGIAGTYVLGAGADTFTGGAGVDNVTGGAGVDTLTGAAGADIFGFTDVDTDVDTLAGAVTDIITDFVTTSDKLDFDTAGAVGNYTEQLTAAADLTALLAAADTALNGTVQYYFGVVGTNGYLVQDVDGIGYTNVIQLTGVTDMAAADIV